MICYGKTASNAVSAMSYLASIYYNSSNQAGSMEVSQKRKISKPLVAKVLTILSTGGLVKGIPGPHGGYTLAKEPKEITLFEIVSLFERIDDRVSCPFGPDWCGNGPPCPLHDEIVELKDRTLKFLSSTSLAVFSNDGSSLPSLSE